MKQRAFATTWRRWSCACLALSLLAPPALHAQQQSPRGQTGHSPALKSSQQVTLNFVNADVEAVTRAIGAMLNRQFVVDPRAKGQITVYSEQPMTVREAYVSYLAALRGLGFTVVENGGLLKVVPEADAKLQAGTVAVDNVPMRGDQIITQIFRLNYENPNNLVAVLRPLISPNNTINANPGNNTLVITDYADNLQRLGKIIAALDSPASTDIEVIQLKHAVASDIAPIVLRLADNAPAVPGMPAAAGGVSVLADARSNSLIIRAASKVKLAQMRAVIDKLDLPQQTGSGPAGNIWVVYLKNADATKLATVLRAAFGGGGGGAGAAAQGGAGTPGISGMPSSGSALGGNVTSLGGTSAGGTSATPANAPVSASAAPSTGGFIQADPSTNSLIITAPEPLYRQLRNVIDQLDARRAQIYVESMIVKVDATKAAEFGFQWQNIWGKSGDRNAVGAGTNFNSSSSRTGNILDLTAAISGGVAGATDNASQVGLIPNGLNIGFARKISDFWTLGALAKFLETEAGANVLSTPNLVALDNEEAKIVVGRNVPFVTGSFTNTGASGGTVNPFQTIERKDVGLTLRIKSQIGESGTVRMTIYQENSSVSTEAVPGTTNAGPATEKSSIETTVIVDDGQTIVLGGLLRDEYVDNEGRVPGLGRLPILGHLFRNEARNRVKSNLLVFLRPVVLRNQAQSDALTIDRYEAIRAQQQAGQPQRSFVVPVNEAPMLPPMPAGKPAAAVPEAGAASAPSPQNR